MRDPAWLDDLDDPDDAGHRRPPGRVRPLLMLLAAVPWLLVVALFVVPARPDPAALDDRAEVGSASPGTTDIEPLGPDADVDGQAVGNPDGDGESDDDDGVDGAGVAGSTDVDDDTGTSGSAPSRPFDWSPAAAGPVDTTDLAAIAILAARSWLSGADHHEGDVVPASQDDTSYAEHLHLEALEGDGDLLVARVVALVLDVEAATAPRLRRIAVPLASTPDGPRLLGAPWELPSPVLDVTALSTEPLTDPLLADEADQALRRAGFTEPRIVRLARTTGWPLVVTFSADGQTNPQQVWLRTTADGRLQVAGLAGGNDTVEHDATPDADQPENAGGRP